MPTKTKSDSYFTILIYSLGLDQTLLVLFRLSELRSCFIFFCFWQHNFFYFFLCWLGQPNDLTNVLWFFRVAHRARLTNNSKLSGRAPWQSPSAPCPWCGRRGRLPPPASSSRPWPWPLSSSPRTPLPPAPGARPERPSTPPDSSRRSPKGRGDTGPGCARIP